MNNNKEIVMVGGGSVHWSRGLINDLSLTPGLEDAHFTILDIDEEAGRKIVQIGRLLAENRGLGCTYDFSANQEEAFKGADFVIITISTGDLDAMEYDISIPEDYRIYQTVGDTVGPGGWARGLRNIPVFAGMAKNIEKYSSNAIVLNYTNPMATLTNVFYKTSGLKTVGLCHGLFDFYRLMMTMFDLEKEEDIKVRFGGTNHFFWITELKIRGEDGYEMIRNKMNGRSFKEVCPWEVSVASELFDIYGYLTYIADRHTCEFVPHYLTRDTSRIEKYKIVRTSVQERREMKARGRERVNEILKGNVNFGEWKRSRETAADIISAFVNNHEFIEVVNLPNRGQITNLPEGSIVETLSAVNSVGFSPLTVGELPEQIVNLTFPHIRNQDMIVEAGLEGNFDKALWALCNDPLCAHLTLPEIKEMGMKLMKAHKKYLPQFSRIL